MIIKEVLDHLFRCLNQEEITIYLTEEAFGLKGGAQFGDIGLVERAIWVDTPFGGESTQ